MQVTVIAGRELTTDLAAKWSQIQQGNPHLASPYFCVEFTQAVAAVRTDVYVGILADAGETIGFFPFQRRRFRRGIPVGGPMSDCHGLVMGDGVMFSPEQLVRGCGLWTWRFDHLPASLSPFEPHHAIRTESPLINIGEGFEVYRRERQGVGSRVLEQTARKQRKLEREVGPLRFVPQAADRNALERVIHWKSEQYRRTGLVDLFQFPWAKDLLERILTTSAAEFAGMLSVLYVGDRVAAAHMGMRSTRVWHWWFPTFDHELGSYSPGRILLMRMVEHATSIGITHIDLGKGDDDYKQRFANGAILLAEGNVTVSPAVRAVAAFGRRTWETAKNSPLRALGRVPARALRRLNRWYALR